MTASSPGLFTPCGQRDGMETTFDMKNKIVRIPTKLIQTRNMVWRGSLWAKSLTDYKPVEDGTATLPHSNE